ncbi:MAG TPA: alkaline phosphatase family protein, partial [Streptosporangiaceae bacterium]|nr:alkaline phosphatase family protein [Streptosporangiaceae bacterium]
MSEPTPREPKGRVDAWTEERGACDERRGKASTASAPEASGTSRVLVIGVDGVRFDYLGPDATPAIWAFGQAGFLAAVPVDETTPTWSGPCWATIATGTGVAGHGITGNDL